MEMRQKEVTGQFPVEGSAAWQVNEEMGLAAAAAAAAAGEGGGGGRVVTQYESNSRLADINRKRCTVMLFSQVLKSDSADSHWPHLEEFEKKKSMWYIECQGGTIRTTDACMTSLFIFSHTCTALAGDRRLSAILFHYSQLSYSGVALIMAHLNQQQVQS